MDKELVDFGQTLDQSIDSCIYIMDCTILRSGLNQIFHGGKYMVMENVLYIER